MANGLALITGGAGFIGGHVATALVARGWRVRSLDLRDPREQVAGVEYRRGDVRRSDDMADAARGVDAVYHFAAIVSVEECQARPKESYETNLMGTVQVLEAIRAGERRARIVFASSASVYGRAGREGTPIRESEVSRDPLSHYACQKLASEQAIRLSRVPSVVFRFFNVFGKGQDPASPYSGVISIFADRAKTGRDLVLHGGGASTRDFVSVKDIASACARALDLPESRCDGSAINLGRGEATSVRELAGKIIALSKSKSKTVDSPPRDGDVPHSRADVSRARETLGWAAAVSLDEGLSELLR